MSVSPIVDASAGAIGALLANSVVFPLDVVKSRLQTQSKSLKHADPSLHRYSSATDAIIKIYTTEGLQGLYAGLASGLLGTLIASFSYFFIYSSLRGQYSRRINGTQISTAMELILGAAAGALCQFIVLPIGIINTRQQTAQKPLGFNATVAIIHKEEGLQGFWKGLRASLVLCTNPAITYGLFERTKRVILESTNKKSLTSSQIFIIGAFSKAVATILTYPYIMAKIKLQWKAPSTAALSDAERESINYTSEIDVLAKVYKSEGIRGIYEVSL